MTTPVNRGGFTLIDTLVAIGAVSLLLSLLVTGVQAVRATSGRLACQNKMRQIGLALHGHDSTFGCVPPASFPADQPAHPDRVLSRLAALLPYLDEQDLFRQAWAAASASADVNDAGRHPAGRLPVKSFSCPADPRVNAPMRNVSGRELGMTSYVLFQASSPRIL